MTESVLQRFWQRVNKEAEDGHWVWTGAKRGFGYGQLFVNGKNQSAHRLSWELHNGPIPEGLWVLHKCDYPPCVNPEHLFLGTPQDNALDKCKKGRSHTTYFRLEDVQKIRDAFREGASIPELMAEYKEPYYKIYNLLTGRTFAYLPGAPLPKNTLPY